MIVQFEWPVLCNWSFLLSLQQYETIHLILGKRRHWISFVILPKCFFAANDSCLGDISARVCRQQGLDKIKRIIATSREQSLWFRFYGPANSICCQQQSLKICNGQQNKIRDGNNHPRPQTPLSGSEVRVKNIFRDMWHGWKLMTGFCIVIWANVHHIHLKKKNNICATDECCIMIWYDVGWFKCLFGYRWIKKMHSKMKFHFCL